VASYWIASWVESIVYHADAHDPWTFVAVAVTLLVTAALAAWVPAHRASMVDPAAVLRAH
jgi:putative ABC transport system permease protein